MDNSLIQFEFKEHAPTSKVEHTDLTDIDRAVAGFFQHVIDTLTVSDVKRLENQEFARFADKNKVNKLYVGDFATPQEFLQKLSAKMGKDIKLQGNDLLPACYITRDRNIAFIDSGDEVDVTNIGELCADDGSAYAVLNKSFVNLSYTVTAVAWSRPTLTRLMVGLLMWLRHTKQGRQHVFVAKTKIAGVPLESNVSILGKRDAAGSVVDISLDDTRMVAMSVTIEVNAEVFEAEEITQLDVKADVFRGDYIER